VTDALVAGARVMEAVHSVGCLTGELVRVYESGHKKTGTKRFVVSFAQFDEAQQRFAESKQRKVVLSSQFVVLQSAVVRDVSTGETRVILCYVDINDGNRQTVFVAEVDAISLSVRVLVTVPREERTDDIPASSSSSSCSSSLSSSSSPGLIIRIADGPCVFIVSSSPASCASSSQSCVVAWQLPSTSSKWMVQELGPRAAAASDTLALTGLEPDQARGTSASWAELSSALQACSMALGASGIVDERFLGAVSCTVDVGGRESQVVAAIRWVDGRMPLKTLRDQEQGADSESYVVLTPKTNALGMYIDNCWVELDFTLGPSELKDVKITQALGMTLIHPAAETPVAVIFLAFRSLGHSTIVALEFALQESASALPQAPTAAAVLSVLRRWENKSRVLLDTVEEKGCPSVVLFSSEDSSWSAKSWNGRDGIELALAESLWYSETTCEEDHPSLVVMAVLQQKKRELETQLADLQVRVGNKYALVRACSHLFSGSKTAEGALATPQVVALVVPTREESERPSAQQEPADGKRKLLTVEVSHIEVAWVDSACLAVTLHVRNRSSRCLLNIFASCCSFDKAVSRTTSTGLARLESEGQGTVALRVPVRVALPSALSDLWVYITFSSHNPNYNTCQDVTEVQTLAVGRLQLTQHQSLGMCSGSGSVKGFRKSSVEAVNLLVSTARNSSAAAVPCLHQTLNQLGAQVSTRDEASSSVISDPSKCNHCAHPERVATYVSQSGLEFLVRCGEERAEFQLQVMCDDRLDLLLATAVLSQNTAACKVLFQSSGFLDTLESLLRGLVAETDSALEYLELVDSKRKTLKDHNTNSIMDLAHEYYAWIWNYLRLAEATDRHAHTTMHEMR
jgi:hypothetical protein